MGVPFNAKKSLLQSSTQLKDEKAEKEEERALVGDIKLSMGDKFSVCESFGCGDGATRGAIIADIFVNQPCLLNTFQ